MVTLLGWVRFPVYTSAAPCPPGACARAWPYVLTAGRPGVAGGVHSWAVGTRHTPLGTQVTYKGHRRHSSSPRRPWTSRPPPRPATGTGWPALARRAAPRYNLAERPRRSWTRPGRSAIFPNMDPGQAAPFAVLAGQTITNTGPTEVSGELGVWPGSAVTGFPPGTGVVNNDTAAVALAKQALTE